MGRIVLTLRWNYKDGIMKKIFKYELKIKDSQIVKIPDEAKILSVKNQNNKLVVWAEVSDNQMINDVEFLVIGTGNPIDKKLYNYKFIDSVIMGQFVWHIYYHKDDL